MSDKQLTTDGMAKRLRELSNAVTENRMTEFTMRVPAEPRMDADLVLRAAADRLKLYERELLEACVGYESQIPGAQKTTGDKNTDEDPKRIYFEVPEERCDMQKLKLVCLQLHDGSELWFETQKSFQNILKMWANDKKKLAAAEAIIKEQDNE